MLIEVLIFLITCIIAYMVHSHWNMLKFFDKYDVKYISGYPGVGNIGKTIFRRRHFIYDIQEVYSAFPGEKYVGYLEGTKPMFMIRDPELLKQITVKDFDHFVDRLQSFPEDIEPLFGGSLLMMRGDRWRDMRTTLSPAFTGLKMRQMIPFMKETSANFIEYLKENHSPNEDLDVYDVVRRYATDVIASAGYGLQVNSFKDKENDFFKHGQSIFSFNLWQMIIFTITSSNRKLAKYFGVSIFPKKMTNFFRKLVKDTMDYRTKNHVDRPDMIQLLMDASAGKLKHHHSEEKDHVGFATVDEELKPQGNVRNWTLDELSGQAFIFFVAGFDSVGNTLVMAIHELAINPSVQDKLYEEIKAFKETKGDLTYDNITELKYLDCVLNETLRKWSPIPSINRMCTKPYELPPAHEGGKAVPLKPGDVITSGINATHLDPEYFPEPLKFNPDRFSDENKHKIHPFTFKPFGVGPRNCIASRFALLEVKILLFDLVLNYKLQKGPKTLDPIELHTASFTVKAKGGTWVRAEARN